MNSILNIWSEVKVNFDKTETTSFDILQEQAKAINQEVQKTNLLAQIISSGINDEVTHTLYLFPKNGNGYNYRFIEITSKPDSGYPLNVRAYQSGNTDFGECKTENEFYETLRKIFTDKRLKIVFEQLKNIGNTIEHLKTNKEEY